jgi:hypothetical protein
MFFTSEQAWQDAVVRNAQALRAIVAQLFGLLAVYGGVQGPQVSFRVPRSVHATILRVLRPAESALRRLIVIAARHVKVETAPVMSSPGDVSPPGTRPVTAARRLQRLVFQLFDPRMRLGQRHVTYASMVPRVSFIAPDPPFSPLAVRPVDRSREAEPEQQISVRRMCLRLQALTAALEDLPKQARRLAVWRLRRENAKRPTFTSPLRPGRPPGFRKVRMYDVDLVLDECHRYADGVLTARRAGPPNTS